MTKFRVLLFCSIIILSLAAMIKHQAAQAPVELYNPLDDPKFADLVESGYQPPNETQLVIARITDQTIQNNHQAEYSAALTDHREAEVAASFRASEEAGVRDTLIIWDFAVLLLLGLSALPWQRWADDSRASGRAAAEEAGKLAGRSFYAAKALLQPSPIVGRSGLKTYSVADELSKWSTLHEEGVVSQEEFEEARAALLRREP